MKSAARILADIRYYSEKFGIRSFDFAHDAFTVNRNLVEEICDCIIEQGLNIRWRCTTRVNCITPDLILKMKQAGLCAISLGVETGSARMQKITNKRLDLKDIREKVTFLKKHGIHVALFFMYGFPEETREDLNETLELAFDMVDLGIDYISMNLTRFNPGTKITEENMGNLVFDPGITILSRGIFGYNEEQEMFRAHKEIFPFFYHMNTDVRNNFSFLAFLVQIYFRRPMTMRHLRTLYQGDNLRFYHDFFTANADLLKTDISTATQAVEQTPSLPVRAMLSSINAACSPYLAAVLEYEEDQHRLSCSKEDLSIQKTYGFHYLDVLRKRPIESFSPGSTTMLLQKTNGVRSMKILDMK